MEAVCSLVGVVGEWDMVCSTMDPCVEERVIGWMNMWRRRMMDPFVGELVIGWEDIGAR